MSMEWRTLLMFDALKSKFRWSEFTLKCIENLQCLIQLNDFVDLSSLRPFSHLFETATRKSTLGTVGPSHLQILKFFKFSSKIKRKACFHFKYTWIFKWPKISEKKLHFSVNLGRRWSKLLQRNLLTIGSYGNAYIVQYSFESVIPILIPSL